MRGWICRTGLAAAALAMVPAAGAQAAATPLDVAITAPATRDALLADAAVQVRLTAGDALKAKLLARRGADSLSSTRTVRFSAAGARTVSVPLSKAGRGRAAACGPLTVAVRVNVTWSDGRTRHATLSAERALPGSPACPVPVQVDLTNADRCDFLDAVPADQPGGTSPAAQCLLPFPNDWFTVADPSTVTGRRVAFSAASMPANTAGTHIDPAEYDRADGFSPGQEIVVRVPGLDTPQAFARTGAVPVTDMAQSFRRDQPVVVINARTKQRQLIWAELDSTAGDPAHTALLIRPGRNWREGDRYIVALRNLEDAAGATLPAPQGFAVYRDRLATGQPLVEGRRKHMEGLFDDLADAGIGRRDLYLAWDFTVASARSLAGRMLAVRDDAFAQLGDHNLADRRIQGRAPDFAVTPKAATYTSGSDADGSWDYGACAQATCTDAERAAGKDSRIARRVTGTVTVPCYLDQPGCPSGSRFHYSTASPGPYDTPVQLPGNTYSARFVCKVPRASVNGPVATGNRAAIYGHGLLGNPFSEINQSQISDMAFGHRLVYCATTWIGMASEDIPNAVAILQDLSRFPTLADRVQQGVLDFLFLGRAEIHPQGFASDPAFQDATGAPVIDTSTGRMHYDGNSQGGIIGGQLIAVAPDLDRGALGVPGMNYSTLLQRSVDFNTYAQVLYAAYPDHLDRALYLSMLQMLWDRAEANGYAQHMTDEPYPGTPPHEVLLQAGYGDHQVANVAAEVEARTIGAKLSTPALTPGRSPDVTPFYGIAPITRYPYAGSALTMFDSGPLRPDPANPGAQLGTPSPPTGNTPPSIGVDPHEFPRRTPSGQQQKSDFFTPGGKVTEVCGGAPCFSGGWTGP
ncbi:MAG: hypothetical protein QOH43_3561 [Solirubrobacteraceae bacterium]|nr:hypothetical protein [Solirubrobacteraceae bacterium]